MGLDASNMDGSTVRGSVAQTATLTQISQTELTFSLPQPPQPGHQLVAAIVHDRSVPLDWPSPFAAAEELLSIGVGSDPNYEVAVRVVDVGTSGPQSLTWSQPDGSDFVGAVVELEASPGAEVASESDPGFPLDWAGIEPAGPEFRVSLLIATGKLFTTNVSWEWSGVDDVLFSAETDSGTNFVISAAGKVGSGGAVFDAVPSDDFATGTLIAIFLPGITTD